MDKMRFTDQQQAQEWRPLKRQSPNLKFLHSVQSLWFTEENQSSYCRKHYAEDRECGTEGFFPSENKDTVFL